MEIDADQGPSSSEPQGKERPKAFISYSWSTPRHEDWVLDFANELRTGWGVEAILDKTHLREGDESTAFMERMVTDDSITKVILVCDAEYARKANEREGGAGVEAQILTPEIYEQSLESGKRKYIAVVREYDEEGNACVPAFYGGRIYIDMTDESRRAEKMEKLARWAYDTPLHEPAELGEVPQFVVDRDAPTLGTQGLQRRVLDTLEQGRPEAVGVTGNYFESFATNLERYAIDSGLRGRVEPQIIAGINALKGPRDEAERVLLSLVRYRSGDEAAHRTIRRFFERLMPYTDPDLMKEGQPIDEAQCQPFSFFVPELFRIAIASLLRVEDFHGIGILTRELYSAPRSGRVGRGDVARPFSALQLGVRHVREESLEGAIRRTSGFGLRVSELAEADLLLTLLSFVRVIEEEARERICRDWYPRLLHSVIRHRREPFPVFARADSTAYADRMLSGLGVSLDQLKAAITRAHERYSEYGRRFYPEITNFEGLASLS